MLVNPSINGAPGGDTLKLAAGSVFQAQFQRRRDGNRTVVVRGGMALNEPVRMGDKGVLVSATADRLDADAWRKALAGKPTGKPANGSQDSDSFPLSGLALRAGELRLLGQRLNDVNLRAVMEEGGWQARLASREASGDVIWRDQGRGRLQGRFKQLAIGTTGGKDAAADTASRADEERLSELPGLDISADSFVLRGHALGKLDLKAANRGDIWRLEQLSIVNPDGSLTGDGSWRPGSREETRLNFKLDVGSVEKMLIRLGYPEAVKRGKGPTGRRCVLAWRTDVHPLPEPGWQAAGQRGERAVHAARTRRRAPARRAQPAVAAAPYHARFSRCIFRRIRLRPHFR